MIVHRAMAAVILIGFLASSDLFAQWIRSASSFREGSPISPGLAALVKQRWAVNERSLQHMK